jgi:streptogramin lyase
MPGRKSKVFVATAAAALALCSQALAAPHLDGIFPIPKADESNSKLAAGPDGNIWVVIQEGENDVAKVKPDGSFEEFALKEIESASGIAIGPEQRMWVTATNKVSSFDVGDPKGSSQTFTINDVTAQNPIVAGPDGQMWVGASDNVVHFNPADPSKNGSIPVAELKPKDIDVAGQLLVIADSNNKRIVTMTTSGDAKDIPLLEGTSTSQGVAGSPGGQIAFSNSDGDEGLGLVTPPNAATVSQMLGDPFGVATGSDGAYYFAMSAFAKVQRLTPDGKSAPIDGIPAEYFPRQVAGGPNNTIWVTMEIPGDPPGKTFDAIARISGLEPPVEPRKDTGGKAPETKIGKGPKKKVTTKGKKAAVKFTFSSSTAGAAFECALTKKPTGKKKKKAPRPKFKSCKSPKRYKLKPGAYKFSVRAVAGGLTDASPATRSFKVVRIRGRA